MRRTVPQPARGVKRERLALAGPRDSGYNRDMQTPSPWELTGDAVPALVWRRAGAGIVALVSTRHGGVSPAPWASLNLGRAVGDLDERIDANRERLLTAHGIAGLRLARIHQVHGGRILEADDPQWRDDGPRPQADGMLTAHPGHLLLIAIADCAPVFVTHPASGTVAAVHAGWRGTVAGIAAAAVHRVAARAGVAPAELRAAVGPAIGPCCFEAGPEVVGALPDCEVPQAPGTRSHVDLWKANRLQLASAGVLDDNIDIAALCTACRTDLFFSHRRESGTTGRMLAVIGRR